MVCRTGGHASHLIRNRQRHAEAEGVRSRHDGVHVIHSYVSVLACCRYFAELGEWPAAADRSFRTTMEKIRCIDRTGFAPPSDLETEWVPPKPRNAATTWGPPPRHLGRVAQAV